MLHCRPSGRGVPAVAGVDGREPERGHVLFREQKLVARGFTEGYPDVIRDHQGQPLNVEGNLYADPNGFRDVAENRGTRRQPSPMDCLSYLTFKG